MWCVVLDPYLYGPRYTIAVGLLLLRLPPAYRQGKPDMFWTEESLRFSDGRVPQSADQVETYLGVRWRRFSWHLASWNPSTDNLLTYLECVDHRLALAH